MIVFDLANLGDIAGSMGTSQEVTRSAIRVMLDEEKKLSQEFLQERTTDSAISQKDYGTEEIEEEAKWLETNLTYVLNNHTTLL